jgi:glyoxylase-like metal-dependent hydrolase (beta-lactamase superfamily II)
MLIECFEAGPLATNGYLVADAEGGSAMAIDAPLDSAQAMIDQTRQWNTRLELLINTHGHFDHVLDNAILINQTDARLGIHRDDEPMLSMQQPLWFGLNLHLTPTQPDFYLADGDLVNVGALAFRVLHCPGHSPGSVTLFEPTHQIAFVGDVIFAGSIGRTDLPGGDHASLLRSIGKKLYPLGDAVRLMPGHGPVTSIGRERRTNPYLRDITPDSDRPISI